MCSSDLFYVSGFTTLFWGAMVTPVFVVMALIGWVIYRFRQTRALTLAQFFEMRYSRKFRIFAGFLCFVSGIISYAIFPGIGARLFIYLCGLPQSFHFLGFTFSTYIVLILILLSLAVLISFRGGQIGIMATDFLQGIFVLIICLVISFLFLSKFDIGRVLSTLMTAPPGKSLLNPFDTSKISTFNMWFYFIIAVSGFYNCMGWQATQGYNTSAKTPHEAQMGRILGTFRGAASGIVVIVAAICAYTVMHNPSFSLLAAKLNSELSVISRPDIRIQMTTPLVLGKFLPVGLLGAFSATMAFAFLTTNDTFLLSWGSILIQDVIMPLRKKPLSNEQHMRWLRYSILAVAVFAFLWSTFLQFNEHIIMYWTITSAIFLGGSGSAIIGGLYWKRGTTTAAYSAMIVGSALAVGGFVARTVNSNFPIQGQWIYGISIFASVSTYILVSLIGAKTNFNMDKMLHRGKYVVKEDIVQAAKKLARWKKLFGITSAFTKADIFIYFLALGYTLGIFIACLSFGIWYKLSRINGVAVNNTNWAFFWKWYLYISLGMAVVFTVWLLIGGIIDLRNLFISLGKARRSELDDGRVAGDHNLSDEES